MDMSRIKLMKYLKDILRLKSITVLRPAVLKSTNSNSQHIFDIPPVNLV